MQWTIGVLPYSARSNDCRHTSLTLMVVTLSSNLLEPMEREHAESILRNRLNAGCSVLSAIETEIP
jgi:hypothetical protein